MLRGIVVTIGVSVMVLGVSGSAGAAPPPGHEEILNAVTGGSTGGSTEHSALTQQLTDIQTAIANLSAGAQPPCGAGTGGQRFVVSPDSTEVCDNTTGLNWQKNPDSFQRTHADALVHCPTVRPASRLPEVKELISLVDYTTFNPALPVSHPFTNVQSASYWSASTFAVLPALAWFVYFNNGNVFTFNKTNTFLVWCVRGA